MPFQKGQSGNPAGRRKRDVIFEDACRERTPKALATLDAIMSSPKAMGSERIAAAKVFLEYAHGKPMVRQQVEVTGDLGGLLDRIRNTPHAGP